MKDSTDGWIVNHPYKMAGIMSLVCSILAIPICWKIEDWGNFIMYLPIFFIWNYSFAILSDISERK